MNGQETTAMVTGWVLKRRRNYFKSVKGQIKGTFRKRGELKCAVCGAESGLELHHILPLSMGGDNDIGNMMVLCTDHHKEIHNGA